MDSLIKQTRARYSEEKRLPPRKSVSFKEEKKKTQDWFQRQFSRQMSSSDYDPISDMDHTTAVAAAAYVISSFEQPEQKKQTGNEPEAAVTRPKSRRTAVVSIQEPRSSSKRFSGQGSSRISERQDEKISKKSPWMEKPPTFADTILDEFDNIKPENSEPKPNLPTVKPASPALETNLQKPKPPKPKRGPEPLSKPGLPSVKPASPPIKPDLPKPEPPEPNLHHDALPSPGLPPIVKPPPPPLPEAKTRRSKMPGREYAVADAWERSELDKIKQRYEKLKNRIASWEHKKRAKARHKLDKTEGESDQKKIRALQKFQEDMEYIDQIARGARAQAEKKRGNEVMKVKEKANVIRETGKVPKTCLCF